MNPFSLGAAEKSNNEENLEVEGYIAEKMATGLNRNRHGAVDEQPGFQRKAPTSRHQVPYSFGPQTLPRVKKNEAVFKIDMVPNYLRGRHDVAKNSPDNMHRPRRGRSKGHSSHRNHWQARNGSLKLAAPESQRPKV